MLSHLRNIPSQFWGRIFPKITENGLEAALNEKLYVFSLVDCKVNCGDDLQAHHVHDDSTLKYECGKFTWPGYDAVYQGSKIAKSCLFAMTLL